MNSIKLGQEGEDCWFGFNEVNTIPLQLQINFTELSEDICELWQPLAYGGGGHCAMPPSDPKNKKMYKQYSAVAQLKGGKGLNLK